MHHVTSLAASQTMDHLQDVRLRQLYTVILDCIFVHLRSVKCLKIKIPWKQERCIIKLEFTKCWKVVLKLIKFIRLL